MNIGRRAQVCRSARSAPGKMGVASLAASAPAPRAALAATTALAGLVALTGCTATVTPTPAPLPSTGNAILDWTVSGTKDSAQCKATGAATFNVSLFGSAGTMAGQWVQDCSAFATTISPLLPDTYTGNANLVDAAGAPRTTAVSLAPFLVSAGTTVTVPIDFPASSFF